MTMLRRAGRNASASSSAASVTPEEQIVGRRRPPAAPQSATRDDGLRCATEPVARGIGMLHCLMMTTRACIA